MIFWIKDQKIWVILVLSLSKRVIFITVKNSLTFDA